MPAKPFHRYLAYLLAVGLWSSSGCGRSRPARYFVLDAIPAPASTASASPAAPNVITVGIDPIRLPPYLERQQIVTQTSDVEVRVDEDHRWAEPLDASIPRALAVRLERHSTIGNVILLPTTIAVSPDRIVSIELQRFDGQPGQSAVLRTRYMILDEKRQPLFGPQRFDAGVETGGASVEALVRAMRLSLDRFAEELGSALEKTTVK